MKSPTLYVRKFGFSFVSPPVWNPVVGRLNKKNCFVLIVPLKLSWGFTFEVVVPQNGFFFSKYLYQTNVYKLSSLHEYQLAASLYPWSLNNGTLLTASLI